MRHKQHSHSFGRRGGARKALIKGLVISLVEHGRISTTLAKAKELKRHVERAVTLGKKADMSSRRLLASRFGSEKAAATIVNDISPRFKTRPGGYTRIIKAGLRPGDMAPMALIEFVDYKLPEAAKGGETTVKGDAGAVKKAKARAEARAKHKKSVRTMKSNSRKLNRKK